MPDYNEQGERLSLADASTKARALSARFLELQAEGRDLLDTMEAEKLATEQARVCFVPGYEKILLLRPVSSRRDYLGR